MRAAPLAGGGWTVDGGDRPKKGWSQPQPLVNCEQRGEAFARGGLQGLDEEIMYEEARDLDFFGCDDLDYVGAEWMDLAKAGSGLLSGFGGMFSGGAGGGGGGGAQTPQAAAEKQRLEDEKRRAEESARNLKIGLGIGGGVLAAVGVTLLAVRK